MKIPRSRSHPGDGVIQRTHSELQESKLQKTAVTSWGDTAEKVAKILILGGLFVGAGGLMASGKVRSVVLGGGIFIMVIIASVKEYKCVEHNKGITSHHRDEVQDHLEPLSPDEMLRVISIAETGANGGLKDGEYRIYYNKSEAERRRVLQKGSHLENNTDLALSHEHFIAQLARSGMLCGVRDQNQYCEVSQDMRGLAPWTREEAKKYRGEESVFIGKSHNKDPSNQAPDVWVTLPYAYVKEIFTEERMEQLFKEVFTEERMEQLFPEEIEEDDDISMEQLFPEEIEEDDDISMEQLFPEEIEEDDDISIDLHEIKAGAVVENWAAFQDLQQQKNRRFESIIEEQYRGCESVGGPPNAKPNLGRRFQLAWTRDIVTDQAWGQGVGAVNLYSYDRKKKAWGLQCSLSDDLDGYTYQEFAIIRKRFEHWCKTTDLSDIEESDIEEDENNVERKLKSMEGEILQLFKEIETAWGDFRDFDELRHTVKDSESHYISNVRYCPTPEQELKIWSLFMRWDLARRDLKDVAVNAVIQSHKQRNMPQ